MEQPSIPEPSALPQRSKSRAVEGLLIGLACGLAAWAAMQALHPVFAVPESYHIAGIGEPVERHVAFQQQQDIVDRRHLMLYVGLLGLVLGAALGARLGSSRRAPALAAVLAMVGASLAGALASIYFVATRDRAGQGDLLLPFLRQLLIGMPIGIAIGVGLGICRGLTAVGRGLVAGALGGVLFGVAYTLIVAIGLPDANTESLLPEESLTRLVWLATLGGATGLLAGFATSLRQRLETTASPG